MELHMHSHHYARRMPDWRAAVIGGCVAGAVFLVLEFLAMWAIGQSPWGPPRMIAAIVVAAMRWHSLRRSAQASC